MKFFAPYAVLLLLAFTGLSASAQQLNEDTTTNQPFFKASKFSSRCYVGVDASVVQILKNKVGQNFGVNLNWVINHKFVIMAVYDGLASQTHIEGIVNPTDLVDHINLTHRYVGVGFSYILFDNKLFSLQPEVTDGWGHIQYSVNSRAYHKDYYEIVPAISATYNCTKYFRVGLGFNYRVAAGSKLGNIKDGDISGAGGVIFIKVGTF